MDHKLFANILCSLNSRLDALEMHSLSLEITPKYRKKMKWDRFLNLMQKYFIPGKDNYNNQTVFGFLINEEYLLKHPVIRMFDDEIFKDEDELEEAKGLVRENFFTEYIKLAFGSNTSIHIGKKISRFIHYEISFIPENEKFREYNCKISGYTKKNAPDGWTLYIERK